MESRKKCSAIAKNPVLDSENLRESMNGASFVNGCLLSAIAHAEDLVSHEEKI